MTIRDSGFQGRQAPLGRIGSVKSHEDVDDDGTHVTVDEFITAE